MIERNPPLVDLFVQGLRHRQAGRRREAEAVLGEVLRHAPRHGGALHVLGTMAAEEGRWAEAAERFRGAVADRPGEPAFHSALGAAYQELGRYAEAAECHRQALQFCPNDPAVLSNLGIALAAQGQHEEAVAALRRALALTPDDAEIHVNLAGALNGVGKHDEAAEHCRTALRFRPEFPQAHVNLGNALQALGRLDEAVACYEQIIEKDPGFAQAHQALGVSMQSCGRLDRAADAYREALRLRPDRAEYHALLGDVLLEKNQVHEAADRQRHALQLRPDCAEAHNGLGNALYAQGNLDDATASYQEATRIKPGFAAACYNLGVTRLAQGRPDEARACLLEALRLKPSDHVAHSTYLGLVNYNPNTDRETLLAEHRRWADRHAAGELAPSHDNTPDPDRRLRIGYVSPDFRSHAVAYFLEPILSHHDREKFEVFCYANVAAPDAKTAGLRAMVPHWRDTQGLTVEQMAELIRKDRIYILIDLAGHTAAHRLQVFARKPAPVQVSYLGYPSTTGLSAINYRLGDAVTDPAGEPNEYAEELFRLPGCFCCYAPPQGLPPVVDPPVSRRGAITFGSLHKLEKLNDEVLDLWSQILRDTPGARLLLGRHVLHGATAERLRQRFAERGIGRERLEVVQAKPVTLQYLSVYEQIDIALDPFPWNGHTTACEALWMGVPVIALRGQRHAARMAASVLAASGLTELIADSPADYCRLAVQLARVPAKLVEMRHQLRPRLLGSPLCDGAAFTKHLESAYRQMWRKWCEKTARPVAEHAHPRISLCMIVRNEESNLAACLGSVVDLVDEVIVVDTGSTDNTKRIAAESGARVFDFVWSDDFSAARNECLRHATGDWIFWLDADERLDDVNRERLKTLFAGLDGKNAAYLMAQRSELEPATYSVATVDHVRLFPNHPSIRWQYRVHEQILPAVRDAGGDLRRTDVVIDHTGYHELTQQAAKVDRNLRLLRRELADRPDDSFILFNVGSVYLGRGQADAAVPVLRRSLERCQPSDTIVRKLFVLLTRAHHQLGQNADALAACRDGRGRFPDDPELLFWEGVLLRELGDFAGAESCLLRVLNERPATHFTGADAGMQSYKARHCLAEMYQQTGRHADAVSEWRTVVSERPSFTPAWQGLAGLFLASRRWAEFEDAMRRVRADSHVVVAAAVLDARGHLARGEPSAARRILEQAIANDPNALQPRRLLAQAILQEGMDANAAEKALREALRRDPKQPDLWRDLIILLRKLGWTAEAWAACVAAREYCGETTHLLLIEGLILQERGDMVGAEAAWVHATSLSTASSQLAAEKHAVMQHLATLCREQKRHAEAEAILQSLLSEDSNDVGILRELGWLLVTAGRWAEADEIADRLGSFPKQEAESLLLRARSYLGKGEHTPARSILDRLIAADPSAVRPRIALSYSYLQEGRDTIGAERSLRDILVLDPDNAEARHNLKLLLEQNGSVNGQTALTDRDDSARPLEINSFKNNE